MGKRYRRYKGLLNPPTTFVDHRAAIESRAEAHAGVRVVEVLYGYGASAELTLDVEDGDEANRELVAFLDDLRTHEDTRLIALDADFPLTAEDRDALGGEPSLEDWSGGGRPERESAT